MEDLSDDDAKLLIYAINYNFMRIMFPSKLTAHWRVDKPDPGDPVSEDDDDVTPERERPERERRCANQWCPKDRERHYETLPENERETVGAIDDIFLLFQGVDPDTGFALDLTVPENK